MIFLQYRTFNVDIDSLSKGPSYINDLNVRKYTKSYIEKTPYSTKEAV